MALIPEDIIQQVLDRCDIVDVVSQYVPLKKAGRNFKGLSPFKSEKTPSFVVSPEKQIFHCFSSGTGGNVISFVMKMERLEFPEAVRFLAKQVNIVIPEDRGSGKTQDERQAIFHVNELAADFFHDNLISLKDKSAESARQYLQKRGINLKTVKEFRLGYAPDQWDALIKKMQAQNISLSLLEKAGLIIPKEKAEGYYDRFRNRIVFPIFDTQSKVRAFGARALEKDNTAKYLNSPETPVYTKGQHLYGLHLSKNHVSEDDSFLIVEGYMDCIMPYQAGVLNIGASLGTALTKEQIRLLSRYTKNVIMLYDADEAGQNAMFRSIDLLIEEAMNVKVANLQQGEDPDSYIKKYGVEDFSGLIKKAETFFSYKFNFLKEKYSLDTIESKSKIAQMMLETLGKIEDVIIRDGYIKELAFKLKMDVNVLIEKQKSIKQPDTYKLSDNKDAAINEGLNKTRSVEKGIIKLLLEDNQFVSATKEGIVPGDFHDVRARRVIERIFELFESGENFNSASLINSFEDQEIQQFISEVVTDEHHVLTDKERMHSDCMSRIKNDRLKKIRKELMHKIKEAEISGDHSKLNELKVKFNQIIKG